MNRLKVLTAPPFVMLYYAIIIVLARDVLSFHWLWLHTLFGPLGIAAGLALILWSNRIFKAEQTTINPFRVRDTSALVVRGPFKVTRNPMYLGMVLILLGVTLWSATALGFALTALFALQIDRGQIYREEKVLAEMFGDEFYNYCERVRRWI